MNLIRKVCLLIILFALMSCKKENTELPEDDTWSVKNPLEVSMDSVQLSDIKKAIKSSMPYVDAFLIVKDGFLVYEEYFNDYSRNKIHLICSDTKSITGILTGILLKKKYINSLDQKIIDFFPEYANLNSDPRIKELTIRHLLSFTSGLGHDEWETEWETEDMIKTFLSRNFVADPGTKFNYETPASQVLSAIINKTTGMNACEFAKKELFSKLDIYNFKWPADKQNYNYGGYNSYFRPYDMLKIGFLALNKGIWHNDTIVDPDFITNSTMEHSEGGKPHFEKYGYHWWITENNGFNAFFAGGFGGQFVYVVPNLKLVVAISCKTDAHRENARFLINDYVIPSIIKEK